MIPVIRGTLDELRTRIEDWLSALPATFDFKETHKTQILNMQEDEGIVSTLIVNCTSHPGMRPYEIRAEEDRSLADDTPIGTFYNEAIYQVDLEKVVAWFAARL